MALKLPQANKGWLIAGTITLAIVLWMLSGSLSDSQYVESSLPGQALEGTSDTRISKNNDFKNNDSKNNNQKNSVPKNSVSQNNASKTNVSKTNVSKTNVSKNNAPEASIPKTLVQVKQSVAQPMTNELVLTGKTVADRTVTVRAETAGRVQTLLVERGADVNTGESLLKFAIDDRQVQLLQARSVLAEARANHQATKALNQNAYEAKTELARRQAALDAGKALVRAAELELARADVQAPIDGVVNERFVETGDFVKRGDPLAVIVDLNPIRVVGQVSQRYLGQITVGVAGAVQLLDGKRYTGVVRYVGRIADDITRTFPVELEIANVDAGLIEGITAQLLLPIAQVYAHNLPQSVLTLADNGTLGVKAVADGTVHFHQVEIAGTSHDGVWLSGLPERLDIITAGQAFVQSGQAVTVTTGAN